MLGQVPLDVCGKFLEDLHCHVSLMCSIGDDCIFDRAIEGLS